MTARMGEKNVLYRLIDNSIIRIGNNIRHWEETIEFEVDLQFRHWIKHPTGVYI